MTPDWRQSAYLNRENWPECIPPMGPAREYGPLPWGKPFHDDPDDLDSYPPSHPAAASCGDDYLGDVCPYCGVPVRWTAVVVQIDGTEGRLCDLDDLDDPTPSFHPACWAERRGEIEASLTDFSGEPA